MAARFCFHLNPKFDLFRLGRVKFESTSQFTIGQRALDASVPIQRYGAIGISFLSFRLKNNIGTRKMAAVKHELIDVKSRMAGISDKNLNPWNRAVIQITIVIANQLLALARFEGHFASFLTIIKDNPKADKGYQDRKTRKLVCKGHIEFPDNKHYINIMEPNYGS